MLRHEVMLMLVSRCSTVVKARLYRSLQQRTMFKKVHEQATFCVVKNNNLIQCVLCNYIFTSARLFSIQRHYNTRHTEVDFLSSDEKFNLFIQSKNKLFAGDIPNINTKNEIRKALFVVALFLARQCRPYDDGVFFKSLGKEFFNCFAEGPKICEILDSVPLSRRSITRRTEKISAYIFSQIKNILQNCEFYSISLDETTDINNIAQLIIFFKVVDKNFNTYEQLLSFVPFHGHVNGETLFEAVKKNVFSIFGTNKLSSICTDGAPNMVGNKNGLVGQLKTNNITVPTFHCIIHQQALFAKELNLVKAMDTAVKIINKIKGGHHALTHRKFKAFVEELGADYGDLCLYTDVRWLSRGKSLERLFNLRQEVQLFLEEIHEKELADVSKDENFLSELSFLCDITEIINTLNRALQDEEKTIAELILGSRKFERKLTILTSQLKNHDATSLPRTTEFLNQIQSEPFRTEKVKKYSEIVESLLNNFHGRFKDFKIIQNIIMIHDDPINCEIANLNPEIRSELEMMRLDFNLPLGMENLFGKISALKNIHN